MNYRATVHGPHRRDVDRFAFSPAAPCRLPLLRAACLLGVVLVIALPKAGAQSVLGGAAEPATATIRQVPVFARSSPDTGTADGILSQRIFQRGNVSFLPHGQYQILRATGLQSSPGDARTSQVDTLSAGFLIQSGAAWAVDYTGRWTEYSDPAFRATLGHTLTFDATVNGSDWALQLSQRYAASDSPLVETGQQTAQQTSSSTLSAAYRPHRSISVDMTLKQELAFVERTADTFEWSILPGVRYLHSTAVQVGVGCGAGYVFIYGGPNMEFIRPTAELTMRLSSKTSMAVQGGRETWDLGRGGKSVGNQYSLSVTYTPFTTTSIVLTANQGTSVSQFQAQAATTTGWKVSVTQRLLKHLQVAVRSSGQTSDYLVAGPVSISRTDVITARSVRFSTTILRHGTIGVFASRTRNASSVPGFEFTSRQLGIDLGLRF